MSNRECLKGKNDRIAFIVLVILMVATLCFIFGNSLKGPEASLEQSNKAGEILRPIIDPDKSMGEEEYSFLIRKSGHFLEYAALGFECALLVFLVCGRISLCGVSLAAGGCLLTADVDEFIQSFTERGSKVADVLLDFGGAVSGIALGFAVVYAVRYCRRRSKKRKEKHS